MSTRSAVSARVVKSNPRSATFVARRSISRIKERLPTTEASVTNPASTTSPRVTRPASIRASRSTMSPGPMRSSAASAAGPMIPAFMSASVSISPQSRMASSGMSPKEANWRMVTKSSSRRLSGSTYSPIRISPSSARSSSVSNPRSSRSRRSIWCRSISNSTGMLMVWSTGSKVTCSPEGISPDSSIWETKSCSESIRSKSSLESTARSKAGPRSSSSASVLSMKGISTLKESDAAISWSQLSRRASNLASRSARVRSANPARCSVLEGVTARVSVPLPPSLTRKRSPSMAMPALSPWFTSSPASQE